MKVKLMHAILLPVVLAAIALAIVGLISRLGSGTNTTTVQDASSKHGDHDPPVADEPARVLRLDPKIAHEFGIATAVAGPGTLAVYLIVPGETEFNADRLAHVVPRVPGVVRDVHKNAGDVVKAGEILAVIDSRELADLKAAYLAANEKASLAEAAYVREEGLWKNKISAEQEYLNAKRDVAEARIQMRASEQKLHALGFSEQYLEELPRLPHESFTRYDITAPLDGTIIEKHIVLGEVLTGDAACFAIADMSTIWADLNVYQKDLPYVRVGQEVVICAGKTLEYRGAIALVASVLKKESRTALARVVIPNPQGDWRAGLYVTGKVLVEEPGVGILVANEALMRFDGTTAVFIQTAEGYLLQPVTTGRSNDTHTEVVSGLSAGQTYVARGAFILKSELNKPSGSEH